MNKVNEKYIKCINFDLDTKQLLKIFPNGTIEPCALIKKFFEDRGFEHRQYPGYISKELLNNYGITAIMGELGQNFTWLKNCIQEFDVSNVINEVSVKDQIINSAIQQEKLNNINKPNTNTQNLQNTQESSINPQSNHTHTPQPHKPKSCRR